MIVGGGPAGAATAIELTRHGLDPVVLEAAPGPQAKVGESLAPAATPVLDRLGLLARLPDSALPSYGNRAVWGIDQPQEEDFLFSSAGPGWRVDRGRFEATLAGAAVESGVDWRWNSRLVGLDRGDGGWSVRVATGDHVRVEPAALVVDASGRAGRVSRRLGVRRVRYDRLVAAVAYVPTTGADDDGATLVEATPEGWWYSLFLPGRRLALAFLTDADRLRASGAGHAVGRQALLDTAPATRARVRAATSAAALSGAAPAVWPAHTSRLERV
ncbi:MAG: hypothetical protein JWP61_487, partial [Friedmanniella sp.]|nr:hypothetical protein [Friedmanniella sp.]